MDCFCDFREAGVIATMWWKRQAYFRMCAWFRCRQLGRFRFLCLCKVCLQLQTKIREVDWSMRPFKHCPAGIHKWANLLAKLRLERLVVGVVAAVGVAAVAAAALVAAVAVAGRAAPVAAQVAQAAEAALGIAGVAWVSAIAAALAA